MAMASSSGPKLKGSSHYIWWEKDLLGKGATASVYKCREKRTGDIYAVKVFQPTDNHHEKLTQDREFKILKSLNHDNIVRTLSIEVETTSDRKSPPQVIIMEYCSEGSLFSILEDPVHRYGLLEDEFLLFLRNISDGIKYLSEQKIVHRDIKPGNIMKIITAEGRPLYKLTDFGAARSLEHDEEQFQSLCGTEEYLHPDMYQRAMKMAPSGAPRAFGSSIDLWSVGVTIYHTATGSLPFRPTGGRQNRTDMTRILQNKKRGQISGIQDAHTKRITYDNKLPKTCNLSEGLKTMVVPILAGLLESNQRDCWSFQQFFDAVRNIVDRVRLHLFYPNRCMMYTVFAHPSDRCERIKEYIQYQAALDPQDQLAIFDNVPIEELVVNQLPLDRVLQSSPKNPIFLFNSCENPPHEQWTQSEIPDFRSFNTTYDLKSDYTLAKETAGIMHLISRRVKSTLLEQNLLNKSVQVFELHLVRSIVKLSNDAVHMNTCTMEANYRFELLFNLMTPQTRESESAKKFQPRFKDMVESAADIMKYSNEYRHKIETDRQLAMIWRKNQRAVCQPHDLCLPKVKSLTDAVHKTYTDFKSDKSQKQLPYNEEQIHKFEKNKLSEATTRAKSLAQEHCYYHSKKLHGMFLQWFKTASGINIKCYRLLEKILRLSKARQDNSRALTANTEKLIGQMRLSLPPTTNGSDVTRYEQSHDSLDDSDYESGFMAIMMESESDLAELKERLTSMMANVQLQARAP